MRSMRRRNVISESDRDEKRVLKEDTFETNVFIVWTDRVDADGFSTDRGHYDTLP